MWLNQLLRAQGKEWPKDQSDPKGLYIPWTRVSVAFHGTALFPKANLPTLPI